MAAPFFIVQRAEYKVQRAEWGGGIGTMRRRVLGMWLGLALRAMEMAMRYSAELLADRHMDDVLLARGVLYKAVYGRPAPRSRQGNVTLIQSAIESWEWAHGH